MALIDLAVQLLKLIVEIVAFRSGKPLPRTPRRDAVRGKRKNATRSDRPTFG